MDSLVVIVSVVVVMVVYLWLLEWSGLFDGVDLDDESAPVDEHEDDLGAGR